MITHEHTHQAQQRRDGVWRFWWRYTTNKAWRMAYEVDAYKAWLRVSPLDESRVANMLARNYGLNLTHQQAAELLAVDD